MKKNSPKVWDKVWEDPGLVKEDTLILATEEATVRWQRIQAQLLKEFGSLKNLTVLEIGSGIGTYAALFARSGAKVTLLDYSPKALERARSFFDSNKLKATFVAGDALKLPSQVKKQKFDVSISVGLTEHFKGKERVAINKMHLDVLKKNGVAIMIVPNAYNFPYRIFKFVSEVLGIWKFGEEYPYTRSELLSIADRIKGNCIALFGDNFYSSIKFLLPANFLRRLFGVGLPRKFSDIKKEKGTPFDNYLSYSLILMLKRR